MLTDSNYTRTESEKLDFFNHLLSETEKAYYSTEIRKKNSSWYYSICATPLNINEGVVLGINWGVNGRHKPQEEIPDGKDIDDYNFIKRSKSYLVKYLDLDFERKNFNYSNLCFFRSPKASDLHISDYKVSLELFKKYVKFINPKWILSLGNSNNPILNQFGVLEDLVQYTDEEHKHRGYKGKLFGSYYYSVPHPNARVKLESRINIWEQVFRKN